jgi:hypothetical protein
MSIVPYRRADRGRKRRPLDQAQVVRAALALLDDVGLDELLVLLGDEMSGEIPAVSAKGTWQQRLREMAWNVRRGLLAHRDAARLLALTPPYGPRRLRHVESMLRILRSAGMSRKDAARAAYHCNNFVTEFAADEARFAAFAATPGASRRKVLAQARKHFKSLPRDEYPTLVELADDLTADDSDGLFEFGIEIWLRGLERLTKRKTS